MKRAARPREEAGGRDATARRGGEEGEGRGEGIKGPGRGGEEGVRARGVYPSVLVPPSTGCFRRLNYRITGDEI